MGFNGGTLYNYLLDLFTIVANITGTPALCVPFGTNKDNLPLGMQILGPAFTDDMLYDAARYIQATHTEVNHGK